eukprot:COSAG01_NODE_16402_length_1239_cov_1.642105_2_plen_166_part_00
MRTRSHLVSQRRQGCLSQPACLRCHHLCGKSTAPGRSTRSGSTGCRRSSRNKDARSRNGAPLDPPRNFARIKIRSCGVSLPSVTVRQHYLRLCRTIALPHDNIDTRKFNHAWVPPRWALIVSSWKYGGEGFAPLLQWLRLGLLPSVQSPRLGPLVLVALGWYISY